VQAARRDIEQARGITRLDGPLGNEVAGKIEIEEIDAHLGRVQYDAMVDLTIRPATVGDGPAIASVLSTSFRLLTFLPMLHTMEEDRSFIENVILKECLVMVAEAGAGIVSFLARQEEEIRLLYTHPDFIGGGAGSLLLEAAKASGVAALELWCFQANVYARRFYERRGFMAVRVTDGQDNEEKVPDIRYRWERGPG
jgi:ribosomal protein S18 acetylase RimI-like enzyme